MSSSIEKLVPFLNSDNYREWSSAMSSYLRQQEVSNVVDGSFSCPVNALSIPFPLLHDLDDDLSSSPATDKDVREWDTLDEKAIGCIALRLPYDVRISVQSFTKEEVTANSEGKPTYTSKMMWDKIKTEYGTERTITQFNELLQFNNFAINVQVDPKKQFAAFKNLCNRIQAYSGKIISDHECAFQIISKLPKHDSWEFIRMQLLHKHSSQKDLKMTEVETTILDHYYSLHPHESSNKAFNAHANVAKISGQSGEGLWILLGLKDSRT
ncbi:hypothetical protein VKT23_005899 [Stygiomarasmius scandens]|uniref:DUF4219 domain-containing protein n=1 Tax=Marasmiellus scandens TaxID=2682957 RepID=A0ABR1JPC0_9AGAR